MKFKITSSIESNNKEYIASILKYKMGNKIVEKPFKYVKLEQNKGINNISLPSYDDNLRFFPLFFREANHREILYLSGASGGGKSTFASKCAGQYQELYPNRNVFILTSELNFKDPAWDKIKSPIFVNVEKFIEMIKERIVEDTDFKDSLMIYDDLNFLVDAERKILYHFINKSLELFRKLNTSLIILNHHATSYKESRTIINELQYYIQFGNTLQTRSNRLYESYFNLEKQSIKKINGMKADRFKLVSAKDQYVMSEFELFFI